MKKQFRIFNTIQASAADLSLASGKLTVNGLQEPIVVGKVRKVTKFAYTVGVAAVHALNLSSGVTLAANKMYELQIFHNNLNNGEPFKIRWHSGATAPTATELATALAAQVNAAGDGIGCSASTSTSTLTITSSSYKNGDMAIRLYGSTVAPSVPTAWKNASGTPAVLVEELGETGSSSNGTSLVSGSATYTKWVIEEDIVNLDGPDASASEPSQMSTRYSTIYADASATNYAAFVTSLETTFSQTLSGATFDDFAGVATTTV